MILGADHILPENYIQDIIRNMKKDGVGILSLNFVFRNSKLFLNTSKITILLYADFSNRSTKCCCF